MNLKGKVAIVTGGASGIGEACVLTFVDAGAKVLIADSNAERAHEVAETARGRNGEVEVCALDVSQEDEVKAMVALAEEKFGGLDCAVNSAGIGQPATSMLETPASLWNRMWEVHALGTALCMRYQIEAMLRRGSGSIINISSGSGLYGTPKLAAYSTVKHGIVGMTKSAAVEFGPQQVRVNALCPGLIIAPLSSSTGDWKSIITNPMGRPGQPHEVADAALWLASDRSSFVTGQAIAVDGGREAGI